MAKLTKKQPRPLADKTYFSWEKQAGEPDDRYSMFHIYMMIGPARTVEKAVAIFHQKNPDLGGREALRYVREQWYISLEQWNWKVRAKAFDDYTYRLSEKEVVSQTARLRTDLWTMYERLMKRAEEMLSFPLKTVKTVKDAGGRPVTYIIKPNKWYASDVNRTIEMAAKLGQIVTNTQNPTVNIKAKINVNSGDGDGDDSPRSAADMDWLKNYGGNEGVPKLIDAAMEQVANGDG